MKDLNAEGIQLLCFGIFTIARPLASCYIWIGNNKYMKIILFGYYKPLMISFQK